MHFNIIEFLLDVYYQCECLIDIVSQALDIHAATKPFDNNNSASRRITLLSNSNYTIWEKWCTPLTMLRLLLVNVMKKPGAAHKNMKCPHNPSRALKLPCWTTFSSHKKTALPFLLPSNYYDISQATEMYWFLYATIIHYLGNWKQGGSRQRSFTCIIGLRSFLPLP